ncbi:MAG: YciI family protein, partial [Nocardioidaceae bacterium]
LGRTMWEFPCGSSGGNRYLVLGLGSGQPADTDGPTSTDALIAHGPLLSDDGSMWVGTAALVSAPDSDTARAVLAPEAERYADIEVHDWRFGGRPSST